MSQADVSKLVSQLRIRINPRHKNLKNPEGTHGRLKKLRKVVTGLIKYERIELNYIPANEARGYAERLISEAIRHGDCHTPTMEMADFWLEEKQLIHKLFKVLAPRYQNCPLSYTKLYRAPKIFPVVAYPRSVLELRGNPFPPLIPDQSHNRNLIHNILLEEARKDYRAQKYAEIAEKLSSTELENTASEESVERASPIKSAELEPEAHSEGKSSESTQSDIDSVVPSSSTKKEGESN